MGKLNIWEEHVINEILSCTEFNITLVKDVDFFLCLSYNRNKYSAIANSIKNKDWKH